MNSPTRAEPPPTSNTDGASYSRAIETANSRRLKRPGRRSRWSACSSSYRWSNENALRRKCSRTCAVLSLDLVMGLLETGQSELFGDLPEPRGDQAAAGIAER